MKLIFLALMITANNLFAQDMSRTEKNEDVYLDQYVGKCSTHQDYEGKYFQVGKTIIKYFEPNYHNREHEMREKTKVLEKELVLAAALVLNSDSLLDVDDLTVDKIQSTKFKGLDLFRLNVGVGGGNGIYLIFNRVQKNQKISYELMSNVLDGGVEFCDSKVWLN